MEKTCIACGATKPLHAFYANGDKGYRPECAFCHVERRHSAEQAKRESDPLKYWCESMARNVRNRLRTPTGANACYKGVELRITELEKYLYHLYGKEILALHYAGKTPSLDRIDPNGHYEHGNVRVISHEQNSLLGLQNAWKVRSKAVTVTYPNGATETFDSVSEASRVLGIKRDTIIRNRDNGTTTKTGLKFA